MKKNTFTALLLALMWFLPTSAQLRYGVRCGLNLAALHYYYDDIDEQNPHPSFYIGPTVKMNLMYGFGFDASLIYDRRSTNITPSVIGGPIFSTTICRQQIALPVNLRYDVGLGRLLSAYFFAGPQIGINVGDSNFKTSYGDWDIKAMQLGANLGVGITLSTHWLVTANYSFACNKTADIVINTGSGSERTVGNGKMNAWQIGLGYYF